MVIRALISSITLLFLAPLTHAQEMRLPLDVQIAVNKAIDKGRDHLLRTITVYNTGLASWVDKDHEGHALGYTALPGLTLLECGVNPKDQRVQMAAAYVRQKCLDHTGTYEISLSILFLDKLGQKSDRWLIEKLALRLMSGQSPTGGWSYRCYYPSDPKGKIPKEVLYQQERDLHGQMLRLLRMRDLNFAAVPPSLAGLPVFKPPQTLETADPKDKQQTATYGTTDGSNTQFAILALWAAPRHNVPVKRSLDLVVRRYETSQNTDGSWGYRYKLGGQEPGSHSMTCVGLLGLAVGHGLAFDQRIADMPTPALLFLGGLGQAARPSIVPNTLSLSLEFQQAERANLKNKGKDPRIAKGFAALARNIGTPAGRLENIDQQNLYFLWSIERVGVLYSLPTIGRKDWYHWGCEILVANQQADGHWEKGEYHGNSKVIDTCLALLFLKKANFATDLAMRLPFDPETLTKDIIAELPTPVSPTPAPPPIPPDPVDPGIIKDDPKKDEDTKGVVTPPDDLYPIGKDAQKPAKKASPDGEDKPRNKMLIPVLVAVGSLSLLVLLGLVVFLVFVRRKDDEEHERQARKKKKKPAGLENGHAVGSRRTTPAAASGKSAPAVRTASKPPPTKPKPK